MGKGVTRPVTQTEPGGRLLIEKVVETDFFPCQFSHQNGHGFGVYGEDD